jgi:hypothetical protein
VLRPVTEPVEQRGGRRRWSPRALFALGTLIVLVVVGSGLIGRLTGPAPSPRTTLGGLVAPPSGPSRTDPRVLTPASALVVTSPTRSGAEVTTRRLTVTGYVLGPPAPVRISLQGRGNRTIESIVVEPARDPLETRPQRVARFTATFDVPNPRPNGEMLVELALLTDDGQAFSVVWRYVRIGAVAAS